MTVDSQLDPYTNLFNLLSLEKLRKNAEDKQRLILTFEEEEKAIEEMLTSPVEIITESNFHNSVFIKVGV